MTHAQITFYPHLPFVCALARDEFNNISYMTMLLMLALTISNQRMHTLNSHCYEKDYSTELSKELTTMLIFSNKLIRHSHHVPSYPAPPCILGVKNFL